MSTGQDLINRYRSKNSSTQAVSASKGQPRPEMPDAAAFEDIQSEPATITEEMRELLFSEGSLGMEEMNEYWGDYKRLASSPKPGSVLHVFKSHKVGFKEMQTYFSEVYLKRLGPAILDPDIELHTYVLYSLVVPHSTAIELAEMVSKAHKQAGQASIWPLLSKLTGQEMQDRGDVVNLVRVILRRYPKVMDFFIPPNVKVKG